MSAKRVFFATGGRLYSMIQKLRSCDPKKLNSVRCFFRNLVETEFQCNKSRYYLNIYERYYRIESVLDELLANQHHYLEKNDKGMMEACSFVAYAWLMEVKRVELLLKRKRKSPFSCYLAGMNIGEFWLSLYDLYLDKKVTFLWAVDMAYVRGETLAILERECQNDEAKKTEVIQKFVQRFQDYTLTNFVCMSGETRSIAIVVERGFYRKTNREQVMEVVKKELCDYGDSWEKGLIRL